jgi:hypothetical protein
VHTSQKSLCVKLFPYRSCDLYMSCLVRSYVSVDLLCGKKFIRFLLLNQGLGIFTMLYTTYNVVRRGISLTSGCSMGVIKLMLLKFTY